MTIPSQAIVIAFICTREGSKFLTTTMPGATSTARQATARQRCVLHCMNEHRGSQTMMVEEFMYKTHEAELKALEKYLHLPRYHHPLCGEIIQNMEDVINHKCDGLKTW